MLDQYRNRDKIGLMAHMVIGYPHPDRSHAVARALIEGGADILEIQIPFSDPIADGPVIMEACDQALAHGQTTEEAVTKIQSIAKQSPVPVVVMCYYNTVFAYGVERFCKELESAGVTGLIIPDMSIDEEPSEKVAENVSKHGMHMIRVLSPASTDERIRRNAAYASGMIYTSSRYGVTGSQTQLDTSLQQYLDKLHQHLSVPVAVGFGIATPEQVSALRGHAALAVVGSAILRQITDASEHELSAITSWITQLKG